MVALGEGTPRSYARDRAMNSISTALSKRITENVAKKACVRGTQLAPIRTNRDSKGEFNDDKYCNTKDEAVAGNSRDAADVGFSDGAALINNADCRGANNHKTASSSETDFLAETP